MPTDSAYISTLRTIIQYLSLAFYFVTLIFGTIGGICNLITFTAPQLRRNACVFYLLCASSFQLLSILFIVPTSMATNNFGNQLERQAIIYCKIRYYFVVSFPQLATYYLLLSILDRYFASCGNVTIRAWSQLKVAQRLSTIILIGVLISNIHLLVFYTLYNNNCQILPETISSLIISIYTLVIGILLPYTLMLILCVFTLIHMRQMKRRVRTIPPIQNHHSVTDRLESHIIVVIVLQVVVSSMLLLLRIGSYVYSTLTSGNLNKTMEERVAESFALQLGVSLYYFSFGLSFYVSILTSKYFRNILCKQLTRFYRHCREQF